MSRQIHIHCVRDFQTPIRGIPIYVGRATPLGNPFIAGRDGKDKKTVVVMFNEYLKVELKDKTPTQRLFLQILDICRTADVTLICWCEQPGPCHAHIIRYELLKRL